MTSDAPAGHRVLPHTADVAVEAWAPTAAGCAEEAVRGLLDCFLDTEVAQAAGAITFDIARAAPENMLLALLDEMIYWTDVGEAVPVDTEVNEQPGGDWRVQIWTAARDQVEVIGAVPKAVTQHELSFAPHAADGWRCRILLDV